MSICFEKFSTAEWSLASHAVVFRGVVLPSSPKRLRGRLSGYRRQDFFVCFRSWLKGLVSIFKNHFRESSLEKTFLVTSLSKI